MNVAYNLTRLIGSVYMRQIRDMAAVEGREAVRESAKIVLTNHKLKTYH